MTRHPEQPTTIPHVNDLLCFLLYSTSLSFSRVYRGLLDELGITYPQFLVMLTLWNSDGLSVGEICGQLGLDTGTLTPLLKRLEGSGFLVRRRSTEDERRVIVTLTDLGQSLRDKAGAVFDCVGVATGLDKPAVARLMNELSRLRSHLEAAAPVRPA